MRSKIIFASLFFAACTTETFDPDPTAVRGPPPPIETAVQALAPNYCGSNGGSTQYEAIQRVTLTVNANRTVTLLVDVAISNPANCTAGNPCPSYDNSPEYVNAWIDWNGDNTWSAAERVMNEAGTGYLNINYQGVMSFSATVPIPASAQSATWARANLGWGFDPDNPCQATWPWGNVEDTAVVIDTPRIEAITVSPNNAETMNNVTLTAQIHQVPGFTISNIQWGGDVAPSGSGNPSYTYRPAAGTHGLGKKIEATLTYVQSATGQTGQHQFSHTFDLFFDKNGDEDNDGTDNWWEYWPQNAEGATTIHDSWGTYRYVGGSYSSPSFATYNGNPSAPSMNVTNRSTMSCAYNYRLPLTGTAVYDFSTLGSGIDCIETVLAHERRHHQTDLDNGAGGAWNGLPDADNDELPDMIETNLASLGFDPSRANSFPAFPFGDDEEVYCDIAGYHRTGIGTNDFASPGKQTNPAFRAEGGNISLVATFPGTATDHGVDLDNNGLFDHLALEIDVQAIDPGNYHLSASANDAFGNLIWTETSAQLGPGLQTVTLLFDGPTLRNFGAAGPLEVFYIQLTGGTHYDIWPTSYWTAPYTFDQFDTSIAYFNESFSDAGSDTDSDGAFDALIVQVGVQNDDAAQPVEVIGWLTSASGVNLGSATVTATLAAGATSLPLVFDADPIRLSGEPGPYYLTGLDLRVNGQRVDFRPEAYSTANYAAADFDGASASLAGTYSDRSVDLSGNGLFDQLIVGVDVLTSAAGTHFVWASLVDAQGALIARKTGRAVLSSGAATIEVIFDSAELAAHGVDGPWRVEAIELYEPSGVLADVGGPHQTAPYLVSSFSRGLVVLQGVAAETTTDLDNDALFDSLDLTVEIIPEGNGVSFVLGRLITASGQELGWASNNALATAGVPQAITLSFPGSLFSGAGEDGPYTLDTLQLYHSLNPGLIITRYDYYQTAAYSADDFERGAVIEGIVYGAQWAPAPGVGLSLGSGEFTHTDASGRYRLISATGGALSIDMDSGSVPGTPRIFEQGIFVGVGNSWNLNLALGDERRVDFVFAAPDTTAPIVSIHRPAALVYFGYQTVELDVGAIDNESGVVDLAIEIDGAPYENHARLTMNDLGSGTHQLTAVARNFEGNLGSATVSFEVIEAFDITPPAISITSPQDGAKYRITESIVVTASTADSESLVDRFELTLDATPIGNGDRLEMALLGLGAHTITGVAVDFAGNTSTAAVTFEVALPDETIPSIEVRAPLARNYEWTETIVVDVQIGDDDTGIASSAIVIDGVEVANGESVLASALGLGRHLFRATAVDFADNHAEVMFELTVGDSIAPAVTIRSPEPTNYDARSTPAIVIDVAATDMGTGLGEVSIALDGAPRAQGDSLRVETLAVGAHVLTARANDLAGNVTTATVTFTVVAVSIDATPPVVSIAMPAPAAEFALDAMIPIAVSATDEVGVVSLVVRAGDREVEAETSISARELGPGTHEVVAVARDAAGNEGTARAGFSILPKNGEPPEEGCSCRAAGEAEAPWSTATLLITLAVAIAGRRRKK